MTSHASTSLAVRAVYRIACSVRLLLAWCTSITSQLAEEVERGSSWFVACVCIGLSTIGLMQARVKPLWYDELSTYYLSHLPHFSSVWSAVKAGADLNPPLIYIFTRTSYLMFGGGVISTRLPEILGFVLMSVCLFVFVSRASTAVFGLIAMLVPWVSGAQQYCYEARPYALVLGCCGLACVSWQAACRERRRAVSLAVLSVSLAGALLSHCYAVLALLPFCAAEVVRFYRRRQADWPLWVSIASALPCTLMYLPLLHATASYHFDNGLFRPSVSSLAQFWRMILVPAFMPLLLSFIVLVSCRSQPQKARWLPGELALAIGFLLLPVVALIVAVGATHVYMDRYCLPAIIGCSVIFGFLASMSVASRHALVVLMIFSGGLFSNTLWRSYDDITESDTTRNVSPQNVNTDLPFVVSNGLLFLQLDHYADSKTASRLHFLRNLPASLHYTKSNVFDNAYKVYNKVYPIRGHIDEYDDFMREHSRFLVYGPMYFPLDWLIYKLVDEHAEMLFKGQFGDNLLFEVKRPTGR